MSFGARFLRHPERFPERQEGDPWGEREVTLHLPGGPYRVRGLSAGQEEGIRATFPVALHAAPVTSATASRGVPATSAVALGAAPAAAATASGAAPIASAAASRATPAPIPVLLRRWHAGDLLPVDVRGWEYGLDFDWTPVAVRMAGLGLLGRLDWRVQSAAAEPDGPPLAGALWTPEDGGERFPGVFENFLRVLVAYRLLDLGGAVLHSAGVVKNGAAYLFLGRSGAGKTTAARFSLARGAEVLSDDLNALVAGELAATAATAGSATTVTTAGPAATVGVAAPGGCAVLKLPFTGDLGERRALRPPVPLAALLRLEQHAADALVALSRAETLACLLACSPFVNVDPYRRERLEQVLLALVVAAGPRAFTLRFSLGGGFWSIIDAK